MIKVQVNYATGDVQIVDVEVSRGGGSSGGGGGRVNSVVAGTNVTVDNTDPRNPVVSSTGGSGGGIPQYNSDPVSPAAEDAWVLRTTSGGAGGGKLKSYFGLGFPVTTPGTGVTSTYQFSYRTLEGTTKRVTIS